MPKFDKGTRLGLRLNFRTITDQYLRIAFRSIQEYLNSHDILRGVFRKFEQEFEEAGTFTLRHNLPFIPCDFILTSQLGGLTATIDYDSVTEETFDVTVTGPGKIRMLIGNISDFDTR